VTDPADAGRQRLEAVVRGRVQGVGFRYFVLREANRLGLDGWVANEADGSVRLVAEGDRVDLDRLAERVSVGPAGAAIADLDVRWTAAQGGWSGFSVRSGGHPGD
jgi:acylphosphatase